MSRHLSVRLSERSVAAAAPFSPGRARRAIARSPGQRRGPPGPRRTFPQIVRLTSPTSARAARHPSAYTIADHLNVQTSGCLNVQDLWRCGNVREKSSIWSLRGAPVTAAVDTRPEAVSAACTADSTACVASASSTNGSGAAAATSRRLSRRRSFASRTMSSSLGSGAAASKVRSTVDALSRRASARRSSFARSSGERRIVTGDAATLDRGFLATWFRTTKQPKNQSNRKTIR